ncbi:Vesicle transport v-SNARE 12 [Linum perenne]
MVFYVTPTDAMEQYKANPKKTKFRLGGLVLEGSMAPENDKVPPPLLKPAKFGGWKQKKKKRSKGKNLRQASIRSSQVQAHHSIDPLLFTRRRTSFSGRLRIILLRTYFICTKVEGILRQSADVEEDDRRVQEYEVRKMDLEAMSLQPSAKAMLLAKLREYKSDLTKLNREFKGIASGNQAAHPELLDSGSANSNPVSTGQRERLSMFVDKLNQSSDMLHESRRTVLETEELGFYLGTGGVKTGGKRKLMMSTDVILISDDSEPEEEQEVSDYENPDVMLIKKDLANYIVDKRQSMTEDLIVHDEISCDRKAILTLFTTEMVDPKMFLPMIDNNEHWYLVVISLKDKKVYMGDCFLDTTRHADQKEATISMMKFISPLLRLVYARHGALDVCPNIRDFQLEVLPIVPEQNKYYELT